MVEREWAGRVTGLGDQRVEIAMMRTPDGHSNGREQLEQGDRLTVLVPATAADALVETVARPSDRRTESHSQPEDTIHA